LQREWDAEEAAAAAAAGGGGSQQPAQPPASSPERSTAGAAAVGGRSDSGQAAASHVITPRYDAADSAGDETMSEARPGGDGDGDAGGQPLAAAGNGSTAADDDADGSDDGDDDDEDITVTLSLFHYNGLDSAHAGGRRNLTPFSLSYKLHVASTDEHESSPANGASAFEEVTCHVAGAATHARAGTVLREPAVPRTAPPCKMARLAARCAR
jgi:hypothetical protein